MAENKETAQPGGGAVRYEIRKDGVVCCASYLPLCGFDLPAIKELQAEGYELYADGEMWRL